MSHPKVTTYFRTRQNEIHLMMRINAVIKMEVGPPQVLYRRNLQTAPRCFPGDWKVLNGWGKSPVERIR
jgi:hypothetical protein